MNDNSFIWLRGGKMNLSSRLSQTVKEYGDKPAFIFEGTETSYSQLEEAINKFANRLRELGIKKGDHVAIILGNSPYFVISLYGALKAGAIIIPVNPIYTPHEIAYIINNGDVKAVVTLDLLIPLLENLHERIQMIEHIIVCETPLSENKEELDITKLSIFHKMVSFTKLLSTSSSQFDGPVLEDEDVAVILYT